MGKLVRDRIPDRIRAEGGNPEVRELAHGEYVIRRRSAMTSVDCNYMETP